MGRKTYITKELLLCLASLLCCGEIASRGLDFPDTMFENASSTWCEWYLTLMKNELESLEKSEDDESTQESFGNLPVGLGLLLSRVIIEEIYRGRLEINNHPKSVTVICKII